MAYVITLKNPQLQIYVREPLVGGEFTAEEWKAKEANIEFQDLNDEAFRRTLLEKPFLVCRKFTSGLRVVFFLENVGLIEQIDDDKVRAVLEEIRRQIKEEIARTGGGGKDDKSVVVPPFRFSPLPPGRRFPVD